MNKVIKIMDFVLTNQYQMPIPILHSHHVIKVLGLLVASNLQLIALTPQDVIDKLNQLTIVVNDFYNM